MNPEQFSYRKNLALDNINFTQTSSKWEKEEALYKEKGPFIVYIGVGMEEKLVG